MPGSPEEPVLPVLPDPGGPLKSLVDITRLPVKVLFVNNVCENNDILFIGIYKLLYYFIFFRYAQHYRRNIIGKNGCDQQSSR